MSSVWVVSEYIDMGAPEVIAVFDAEEKANYYTIDTAKEKHGLLNTWRFQIQEWEVL
jgi:hypothetical protein